MSEDANLFAQQEANRRRSIWLVVGFFFFFAWVGFGGDLALYLMTMDDESGSYRHVVPFIGIVTTRELARCIGWPEKDVGFADVVALATGTSAEPEAAS